MDSRQDETETSPLLRDRSKADFGTSSFPSPASSSCDTPLLEANVPVLVETDWKKETRWLGKSSFPLIFTFVFQHMLSVTPIVAVGSLGKMPLAAASLGTLTANMTAFAIIQGFNGGLDTLCSQAYGANKKHLVGIYFQRMVVFLMLLVLPIFYVWWNARPILAMILDDPEIVDLTVMYMRYNIPAVPFYILFDSGKRYCESQGIYNATRDVLILCCPLNAFLNWFLVKYLGLGLIGAPISLTITEMSMCLLLFLWVRYIDGSQCWGGINVRAALQNWGPMISIALPSMLMLFSEWIFFEIIAIMSARFGATAIAAQVVLSSIVSMSYMAQLPIAVAVTNRIANYIGAQDLKSAKITARSSVIVMTISSINSVFWLYTFRRTFIGFFTDDEEVIALADSIACWMFIVLPFPDGFNGLVSGILRGIGRQDVGGFANLISFHCIAFPISWYLAFRCDMGLAGLWAGLVLACAVSFTISLVFCLHTNWRQAMLAAAKRNAIG